MLGINAWTSDAEKLKAVMTEEDVPWRTFVGSETINKTWNNPMTPTYFVIDHTGVIRHKWNGNPGDKAIDNALEKWIEAAE